MTAHASVDSAIDAVKLAIKAGLGVVTVLAVRAVHKKSKKAAIITMIALNAATAAVVVYNIKVANHRK